MTAGVAAAEVSIGGTSQVSVSATGNGDNVLNTHVDMNIGISGSYDNGMTMAATIGYDAGQQVDAGDFELDGVEGGMSSAAPNMTIGYAGYTITADGLGLDDLYDGDFTTGNFGVAGSMGGIDFALTTNIDGGDSQNSYSLSYATGDITLAVTGSNSATVDGAGGSDATKIVATYAMGDTTFTLTSDDKEQNADPITKIGVSTKINDITFSYTAASEGTAGSDVGDDWDASVSYSAGALTASYALDEEDVGQLVVDYDLGGGATAFASMQAGAASDGSEDYSAMGINFKF